MASSNRVQVSRDKEVTLGVNPAGEFLKSRITSEGFAVQKSSAPSEEIENTRQISDNILLSMVPQGGFGFELIYNNIDDILEALMFSTWQTPLSISKTCSASSNVITIDTPDAGFATLLEGQWVKVSGFADGDHIVQVNPKTDSDTFTAVGDPIADEAAVAITITGSNLRNGITLQSFTFEVYHSDLSTRAYYEYNGMVPNTMNLEVAAEAIIRGDIGFIGKAGLKPVNATIGSSYAAAPSSRVYSSASGNVGQLMEYNALLTTGEPVRSVSLNINNNVRREAYLNTEDLIEGEFSVTGQLQASLKDGLVAVDRFYDDTNTAWSHVMTDPAGNVYVITLPLLSLSNFRKETGGKNQTVMGTFDLVALKHATWLFTMQIDKIPA